MCPHYFRSWSQKSCRGIETCCWCVTRRAVASCSKHGCQCRSGTGTQLGVPKGVTGSQPAETSVQPQEAIYPSWAQRIGCPEKSKQNAQLGQLQELRHRKWSAFSLPLYSHTHTHARALPSSWEVLSLGLAFCLQRCSVTGSGSFAGRQSQAHDDCSRFPLKHLLPKNAYDVIAHQSWFLRKRHKSKPVVWTNVCKETQQGSASCATLKQQRTPLQEATSVLSVRFSLEASEFHPLWRASSVKTATNATSLLLASTCLWTVAHAPPR